MKHPVLLILTLSHLMQVWLLLCLLHLRNLYVFAFSVQLFFSLWLISLSNLQYWEFCRYIFNIFGFADFIFVEFSAPEISCMYSNGYGNSNGIDDVRRELCEHTVCESRWLSNTACPPHSLTHTSSSLLLCYVSTKCFLPHRDCNLNAQQQDTRYQIHI